MNRINIALRSYRRESEKGLGCATAWFLRRFYYRFLKHYLELRRQIGPDDLQQALTVIVPVVEKDAQVLLHCLRFIRKMIRHCLVEVRVVASESASIRPRLATCRYAPKNDPWTRLSGAFLAA
jgi:hypothetical protein